MSKRVIFLGLLIIAAAISVMFIPRPTNAQPGPDDILDPAPFNWTFESSPEPHYVGVLEYGQATFDINGESLTTRAYRQEGGAFSIPGPTLNMVPGNKYVLRFRNLLDYEPPSPVHNDLKDPNITNLHTHGVHITGESPGDDVIRMFEGGRGGDYVYDIPADHMGGTYWYHAHHHGSTFLQVSTGGFGFIVIDDSGDGIPANVAAMEERHILIGYLDTGAAGAGGDTLVSGTLPAGWTVNGKVNGDLVIPPHTWQHWRVLLADSDARTKDVTVGANCDVMLLARDGVWRFFNDTATTEIYTKSHTLSLHDALPIHQRWQQHRCQRRGRRRPGERGRSPLRDRRRIHVVGGTARLPARPSQRTRRQHREDQHGCPNRQRCEVRCRHAALHPERRRRTGVGHQGSGQPSLPPAHLPLPGDGRLWR
jgi:hypothetical protein